MSQRARLQFARHRLSFVSYNSVFSVIGILNIKAHRGTIYCELNYSVITTHNIFVVLPKSKQIKLLYFIFMKQMGWWRSVHVAHQEMIGPIKSPNKRHHRKDFTCRMINYFLIETNNGCQSVNVFIYFFILFLTTTLFHHCGCFPLVLHPIPGAPSVIQAKSTHFLKSFFFFLVKARNLRNARQSRSQISHHSCASPNEEGQRACESSTRKYSRKKKQKTQLCK